MQKPQDNLDLFNLDKIIFEKINRIKELTEEIEKKDFELEILDEDIQKFHQKIKKKNKEITNLDQLVRQKDKDLDELINTLIETRNELTQIHNSLIFKFSKNISKIIDFIFPNNGKRGEFKKIAIASILLIQQEGLRKYILTVKAKIRRKEFKLNTIYFSNSNLSISEKDKMALIKKIHDNRKNRLKIKPSSNLELENDGFIISDDKELI